MGCQMGPTDSWQRLLRDRHQIGIHADGVANMADAAGDAGQGLS